MFENTPEPTPFEISTASRLKVWYLIQFRGYSLAQRRELPKVTRLGRLTYECRWYLRATSDVAAGSPSEPQA